VHFYAKTNNSFIDSFDSLLSQLLHGHVNHLVKRNVVGKPSESFLFPTTEGIPTKSLPFLTLSNCCGGN